MGELMFFLDMVCIRDNQLEFSRCKRMSFTCHEDVHGTDATSG